jgi:hypothetical protein
MPINQISNPNQMSNPDKMSDLTQWRIPSMIFRGEEPGLKSRNLISSLRDFRGVVGLGPGTEVPGYHMSSLRDWCDIFGDVPSRHELG